MNVSNPPFSAPSRSQSSSTSSCSTGVPSVRRKLAPSGVTVVVAAGQRMRVRLRDGAVRRPAGMAESRNRGGALTADALLQLRQRPDGPRVLERAVRQQGDPRRVVASVLEALEPAEEKLSTRPPADVPDDPAHPALLPVPVLWLYKHDEPGLAAGLVAVGQPSSLLTSAAMLPQSRSASCSF